MTTHPSQSSNTPNPPITSEMPQNTTADTHPQSQSTQQSTTHDNSSFANMGNPFEFFNQMNQQLQQQMNQFSQFNPFAHIANLTAQMTQIPSPMTNLSSFTSLFNPLGQFSQASDGKPTSNSDNSHTNANTMTQLYGQFFNNMTELSQQIAQQSMRLQQQPQYTNTSLIMDLMDGWKKMAQMTHNHPGQVIEDQVQLLRDQMQLWQNTLQQLAGKKTEPVAIPEKGDKRFSDEEWDNNPIFNFLKQNYLLTTQAMLESIENTEGIDDKTRQRLAFFTRQWVNAVAPTNFLLTNPEVLRLTIESGGQNLVQGMKQLSEDMHNSADTLNIRMTDSSAFRVGDNIATSKGKVIFENYLMQLIQYEPTTEKVKQRPMLLVPPWINKFYIMDLREKNSFIRWAVNQGHTVFVLSWANPTPDYHNVGMQHYMKDGILAAMDEIERITGEKTINITGYCIGGMLTAITLAYLTAKNQADRIASATLWATIIDFSDPGDIGVFIEDKIVTAIDKQNSQKGVFDGRMMGVSFSLLRENSLYWNYYVQNYLKGERPVPFDLLYWNSDCTNVTAALHHFLLREFYINNGLKKVGGVEIDGVKIDLSKVKTPVFMIATLQDHIAKWKGCYAGTQVFDGEKVFILGESGHVAGIMNPPNSKYGYYTNKNYTTDADQWYKDAEYVQDTWWHNWQAWVKTYEGGETAARVVGQDRSGKTVATYGDAPGTYVTVKAPEALAGHNFAEAYRSQLPTQ